MKKQQKKISNNPEPTKVFIIPGRIGYQIVFDKNGYQIRHEESNENDLAAMMVVDGHLSKIVDAVNRSPVRTLKEKKEKRDKIEMLRKLKLELKNNIADIISFILETKKPEDYEVKKLHIAKPGDETKMN